MTQDFNGFGLPPKLLQALARVGFTEPTPIQAQTIPLTLKGRDVLGSAQTGTGKTAAFGIPLIAQMMERPDDTALILTPTRELATQVMKAVQELIPVSTIKTALLIGGEAMPRQFRQLDQKPRLIVGTPGRVNDHLDRGTLKLDKTRFLVLDETDRMLDMGFGIQIDKIVAFIPQDRQTLLFSATMPKNIMKVAAKYLRNPERVEVGSTNTPIANIQQEQIHTSDGDKYKNLLTQLEQRMGSVIIFVKTKHGTERLADKLNKADHRADAIHGDLQQRRRDRVISSFREKKYRILVATDVAARGLDIPHIAHVINYDMPQCPEDYIHRIGRTARAGAEGSAVNLITPADSDKWRAIHRLIHGAGEPEGPFRGRSQPHGQHKAYAGKSYGGKADARKPYGGKPDGRRTDEPKSEGRKPHREAALGETRGRPDERKAHGGSSYSEQTGGKGNRKPFASAPGEGQKKPFWKKKHRPAFQGSSRKASRA
jgi:superfamily II DNA/RNA helicase